MYSNGFDPCMAVKGFRWSERKGSGIAPEQYHEEKMNNEKQDDMNVSFTPLHLKARTVSVSDDLRTYGLLLIICIHESQNS